MPDSVELTWLLLLHHLPPRPHYFRVRVRRQLQRLGAVALKNSAYVLPASDRARAELIRLADGIRADGGEALVAETRFLAGVDAAELADRFRAQSEAAYGGIVTRARQLLDDVIDLPREAEMARLAERLERIAERDHFKAAGQSQAMGALEELRRQKAAVAVLASHEQLSGMVWVTPANLFADGIGCAWLIQRFIDRRARFRFVPARGYRPAPGELGFRLPGTGYVGDAGRSTFEVLRQHFGLTDDPGLSALAELVHDLEFEDNRYNRAEAPGLRALLQGLVGRYASDAERIEHGRRLFDQLYAYLTRRTM